MTKKSLYRCAAVPNRIADKLEEVAARKRKATGEQTSWSWELRKVLENWFKKN